MAVNYTASFSRGGQTAHFFVKNIEAGFGRRGKLHETPFKDTPFFEDLGRKGKVFTVDAYVMPATASNSGLKANNSADATYLDLRNALVSVIENGNEPGVFTHPTMGDMNVVPTECSTTFDNSQGRIETFSITFVEAGKRESLPSVESHATIENESTVLVVDAVKEALVKDYKTESDEKKKVVVPESFFGSMLGDLGDFVDSMKDSMKNSAIGKTVSSVYDTVSENLTDIQDGTDAFADFAKEANDFALEIQNQPQKLINSVGNIYFSVAGLMSAYSNATLNPIDRFKNMLGLFSLFKGKSSGSRSLNKSAQSRSINKVTPKILATKSTEAVNTMIMALATVEVANAVIDINFESSDQMLDIKDAINDMFNESSIFIGDGDTTDTYIPMLELQSKLNQYLNDVVLRLPNVKVIKNNKVMPALVIAYNQHEDSEKVYDVIRRNSISDPNSTPIGELEVIT